MNNTRVLLVDDDPVILKFVGANLKARNFDVDSVGCPKPHIGGGDAKQVRFKVDARVFCLHICKLEFSKFQSGHSFDSKRA